MIPDQYKLIAKMVVVAAIMGTGAAVGYGIRDLTATAELSQVERDHAAILKALSDASSKATSDALKNQLNLAEQIATIDKVRTDELNRAKNEIEKLRADLRSGARRLSVDVRCPVTAGVSETAGTGGVDHGTQRAELDPKAAERLVSLTTYGDDAIRQLNACQEYVEAVRK